MVSTLARPPGQLHLRKVPKQQDLDDTAFVLQADSIVVNRGFVVRGDLDPVGRLESAGAQGKQEDKNVTGDHGLQTLLVILGQQRNALSSPSEIVLCKFGLH